MAWRCKGTSAQPFTKDKVKYKLEPFFFSPYNANPVSYSLFGRFNCL